MIQKEILKKVRRIELRTRTVVNSVMSGEYHSAFRGQGIEFSEVREYQAGDDIRSIDWNVTARMGQPFVKVFEEERELTVMLVVDASSSGEFGSVRQTKNEIAVEVCALLAFSAIKNNDRVGLIVFTDRIERFVPPKKGRKHVLRVVRELLTQFNVLSEGRETTYRNAVSRTRYSHPLFAAVASIALLAISAIAIGRLGAPETFGGWVISCCIALLSLVVTGILFRQALTAPDRDKGRGTNIAAALDYFNRITTRRGIAFLVSDFQATGFEKPLRIANKRHDVIAVTITDPRETAVERTGLLSVEDPESGEQTTVDSSDPDFRKSFARYARDTIEQRRKLFRMNGVDSIDLSTAESYVEPILRFFTARANRA